MITPGFAHPWYLLLLIPVVPAARRLYRRGIREGIQFASAASLARCGRSWRTRTAAVLPSIFLCGLVMAVFALARPRTVLSRGRRAADVVAIEMAVDVSGSMRALDMADEPRAGAARPTRLDAVKRAFADFVAERPHDLIGLITFGGYASTRTPLTADHAALLHTLKGVEVPREIHVENRLVNQEELLTAVGDALATACARLEQAGVKSRVAVLLSDGESNTGRIRPDEAARLAARMGIKVYTVGVGTSGRAPFALKDAYGRDAIREMGVTLDEEQLKQIASETGGRYFNVRDAAGLKQALREIDRLEKTRVEQEVYVRYRELFPWFLIPALCLVVTALGLNALISDRIV